MARGIHSIEGIGPRYAEALKGAGISNIEQLLLAGASSKGRKELARKTGLSGKLILRWVNMCDLFRVDNARFGLTEARLGLAPAVISPYVIRRIGETYARRYFLSAERFNSQTAYDIGLIQQIVTAEQLDEVVEDTIRQLLKSGPTAVAECKQLVFKIAGHDADSQKVTDEYTAALIARLRVSSEGQEGLAAFLEKRKPGWIDD